MSSLVTLTNVTWSGPDGHTLFSDLNLGFGTCRAGLVGRNGVGKTTLLKLIIRRATATIGKVSVSGSLGFLQQTVQVKPVETVAHLFGVAERLALLRRAEAGEASVEELGDIDWSLEGRILSALGRVGLDARPATYLNEMSGGQRTRASLAAVVFSEPDFLLLDEPANNPDREGRVAVINFLAKWRAGAIVVSHDRELLETMDAIVELPSLGATDMAAIGVNSARARLLSLQPRSMTLPMLKSALPRLLGVLRRRLGERHARMPPASGKMRRAIPPVSISAD